MKKEPDTKQKILDAAQHIFAREGFQATSSRAITKRAGVNIAAINYHFGSKEELLKAVLERHLIPLNRVRIERLKKVSNNALQEGRKPSLRDLITAIIEPTLQFKDTSPDAEDFIALVGRAFYEPESTVRKAFVPLIWPLYELIVETFRESLPDLQENIFLWRLHFMFGALSHMMMLCGGKIHSDIKELQSQLKTDTNLLIEIFVPFIMAGMEAQ